MLYIKIIKFILSEFVTSALENEMFLTKSKIEHAFNTFDIVKYILKLIYF